MRRRRLGLLRLRRATQQPSGSTISFVTATGLIALYDAKQAGIDVPERLVRRAVDSIHRQRKPDFSYCYGEYLKYQPMHPVNRPAASTGRSQACNLALRLWGDKDVTDDVLMAWLDRLFARNLWLDMGRKRPVPHESWFMVAGYFFYYGHYYAALCIEQLPPSQRRRTRTSWPTFCFPCRARTARGGTFRCTITIRPTARPCADGPRGA